jgi:hypothetical protein
MLLTIWPPLLITKVFPEPTEPKYRSLRLLHTEPAPLTSTLLLGLSKMPWVLITSPPSLMTKLLPLPLP